MAPTSQRLRWIGVRGPRELREPREPRAIVRRGLGGGALGGALLGVGLTASVAVLSSPSPGLLASMLLAGVIGALVALPAALMAVIAYQALEVRSLAVAWLAGSLAPRRPSSPPPPCWA